MKVLIRPYDLLMLSLIALAGAVMAVCQWNRAMGHQGPVTPFFHGWFYGPIVGFILAVSLIYWSVEIAAAARNGTLDLRWTALPWMIFVTVFGLIAMDDYAWAVARAVSSSRVERFIPMPGLY